MKDMKEIVQHDGSRVVIPDYVSRIQKVGFWAVIVFVIGMVAGAWSAKMYYAERWSEVAKLKGVIIGGVVYDVRERP